MTDFAVVIPTYRRPAYLAEAIRSVLAQTHPPTEVVVVCDGPGSSIPDELREGPVRVVEQPHGGEAVARNTGVAATTSEWVCFLDDDDLWHPDRLRLTAEFLAQRPEAKAVTASSWCFASEPDHGVDFVASDLAGCLEAAGRVEPVTDMSYLDINGRSFELLLERNRGNISGSTVRRDVLTRAGGFPVGYTCGADWMMFINVARYTEWHYLEARLSFIRKHPGNNTSANPTNGLTTVRAIKTIWSEQDHPVPPHRELAAYGSVYRWTIQNAMWDSIRRRHLRIAYDTFREGFPLLVRRRDQAYALVPPPITWRIERLAAARGDRRAEG
jgi:glycosyltransferase involved in cell wall biosynthesis